MNLADQRIEQAYRPRIAYFTWTRVSHRSSRFEYEKAFGQINSEMSKSWSEELLVENVKGNG